MSFEFTSCQHPFGAGVHVAVLSPIQVCVFVELLELEKEIAQAYAKLLSMTAPSRLGHCCGLYRGTPPDTFTSAWLALKLSCRYSEEGEHIPRMRGIAVLSEAGFEELAKHAARGFKEELKKVQLFRE